jgi:HEAT repeat protein
MNKRFLLGLGAVLALGLLILLILKSATPAWETALRDRNPGVRAGAIRSREIPLDSDLLIQALKDENADVRLLAARHLRGPGPAASKRIRALIEAFKDPHAGVRREAAKSVGLFGPEAAALLNKALKDPDPRVSAGAAYAVRFKINQK